MKEAPKPNNEAERLEALRSFHVLDTLPEESYDDITQIAAAMCGTPIAIVSLVDDCRQWFKSRVGLEAPETTRDIAFCSHAILTPDDMLIVEDTLEDDRFFDNPLVTSDPKLRFYAGAPLVTSDGHALGTLCVIDREPRKLTKDQIAAVRALSRQVIAQLELRRANQQLEQASQALEKSHRSLEQRTTQLERSRDALAGLCDELEIQSERDEKDLARAEAIQRSLLPRELPDLPGCSLQTLYRPGRSIGGDLFDVVWRDDRYCTLVIADAAGHGVSAALVSLLFRHRLQSMHCASHEPIAPSEALAQLNEALFEDLSGTAGLFVTAAYAVLDLQEMQMTVASAGHPPVLLLHDDERQQRFEHTGPALGLGRAAEFHQTVTALRKGDQLVLYTDGLIDTERSQPANLDALEELIRESDPTPSATARIRLAPTLRQLGARGPR